MKNNETEMSSSKFGCFRNMPFSMLTKWAAKAFDSKFNLRRPWENSSLLAFTFHVHICACISILSAGFRVCLHSSNDRIRKLHSSGQIPCVCTIVHEENSIKPLLER